MQLPSLNFSNAPAMSASAHLAAGGGVAVVELHPKQWQLPLGVQGLSALMAPGSNIPCFVLGDGGPLGFLFCASVSLPSPGLLGVWKYFWEHKEEPR